MALRKDLSINYLGFKCENPFFLASSPVCSSYDMVSRAFEAGWGGVFYKTIGVFIPDECSPRFDNCSEAGYPWSGFKNMEMISDKPLDLNLEYIAKLKKDYPEKMMVVSIMGSSDDEWKQLAKQVTQAGADAIECNFSCPQMVTHTMGSDVGQSEALVNQYTKAVVSATHLPVIAKMTPNIGNMELPAIAAVNGGAKGIAAINTIKSITNLDLEFGCPMPVVDGKSSISGYSGNAVRPIALRFITQLAQEPKLKGIPLSGIGGIESWRDAVEFLMVGASNVQVCTAVMQYGYRIVEDMISGVSHFMDEKGYSSLEQMVGKALPNIVGADDINRDFKSLAHIDQDKCISCGRCYVSCQDGGHQAIDWNEAERKFAVDEDKCVGCQLCFYVCPVMDCITPGKTTLKTSRFDRKAITTKPQDVAVKSKFK